MYSLYSQNLQYCINSRLAAAVRAGAEVVSWASPPNAERPPCVANANAPPWLKESAKTKGTLSICQKFSDEIIKNWDSAGAGGGGILPAKYTGHGLCTSTPSLNICVGKEEKDNKTHH